MDTKDFHNTAGEQANHKIDIYKMLIYQDKYVHDICIVQMCI